MANPTFVIIVMDEKLIRRIYLLSLVSLIICYILGMLVHVLEVDAAQYASISLELLQRKGWWTITDGGQAYLDKPPLLFWLDSRVYLVLGYTDFAYKVPAIISTLAASYSLFRMGRLWYGSVAGRIAPIMYLCTTGVLLMNNDVRTDAILTNYLLISMWHISEYLENQPRKLFHLTLAFVAAGLAMMAKGPIALVLPALGIFTHLLLRRSWRPVYILHFSYGLLIFTLVCSPAIYSVYHQYGWYGVRFYLWIQSFGRITGENVWNNHPPFYFLTLNWVWSALPWAVISILAVIWQIKRIVKQGFRLLPGQEFISVGIFILGLLMLSTSQYQLPHYINILLPYSILSSAGYLGQKAINVRGYKWLHIIQGIILLILIAVVSTIALWAFPVSHWYIAVLSGLLLGIGVIMWLYKKAGLEIKVVYSSALICAGLWVLINGSLFPQWLSYQSNYNVVSDLKKFKKEASVKEFITYGPVHAHALDFYAQKQVTNHNYPISDSFAASHPISYVYTDLGGYNNLKEHTKEVNVIRGYGYYNIAFLSIGFINPKTRSKYLQPRYLLEVEW